MKKQITVILLSALILSGVHRGVWEIRELSWQALLSEEVWAAR